MEDLLEEIARCRLCTDKLPQPPRPVVRAGAGARILIVGQAPGRLVHASGVPWDDQSGRNLRTWLGVSEALFYNENLFALVPMGLCYPGKGSSGDLPPMPACAPKWHPPLIENMPDIRLTLLIGHYAQQHYLGAAASGQLTDNVKNFDRFLPRFFPLVHPSPRNRIWQKKNPWFEAEVLPALKQIVGEVLADNLTGQ